MSTEFFYEHGRLRPVATSDLDDLRRWRNHPHVRRAMVTQHEISPEEHLAWWEKLRNDDTKHWYIYTEKEVPAAVTCFFGLDRARRTSWWGFYLCDYSDAVRAHRSALAQRLVGTMIEHAFEGMELDLLLCEVRESNPAAIELYRKFGFVESDVLPSKAGMGLSVMELKRLEV